MPSSTTMSIQGRCCVILFYALRCGTSQQDTDVLNFTCKIIPHGAGYDDDDGEEAANSHTNGIGRKRKRLAEEMVRESKLRNKSITELVATVKTMVQSTNQTATGHNMTPITTSAIAEMTSLTKNLAELQRLDDGSDISKKSIDLTKTALRKVQEQCAELLQ